MKMPYKMRMLYKTVLTKNHRIVSIIRVLNDRIEIHFAPGNNAVSMEYLETNEFIII
jgi:hypothetical protein